MKWAIRKLGVDEWIIHVVMAMYENAESAVNIHGSIGDAFPVKVWCTSRFSVKSPAFHHCTRGFVERI